MMEKRTGRHILTDHSRKSESENHRVDHGEYRYQPSFTIQQAYLKVEDQRTRLLHKSYRHRHYRGTMRTQQHRLRRVQDAPLIIPRFQHLDQRPSRIHTQTHKLVGKEFPPSLGPPSSSRLRSKLRKNLPQIISNSSHRWSSPGLFSSDFPWNRHFSFFVTAAPVRVHDVVASLCLVELISS